MSRRGRVTNRATAWMLLALSAGSLLQLPGTTAFIGTKPNAGRQLPSPRAGWIPQREQSTDLSSTASSSSSSSASSSSDLAPVPTEWQGEVLSKLKSVIDPDLGADIVTLGFVQDLRLDDESRAVSFNVELTTPACPVKDQFQADCRKLVEELPWAGEARVTMTAQPPRARDGDRATGMSQVGAVVAVSSCKGGVGKSTTAVNLAFALQSLGAAVGIFDVDVYGPSLPTMVKPDDEIVRFVGRQIAPLQRNGVRLMSFGYVNDGSAVMRGPMVTQLLDQFMSVTEWGALDYLILDMPPGTGDIQLTLTQRLNITAAVIVTTPQELSFADVVRGVEMFDTVNVPSVAVVENMAYYEMENDDRPSVQEQLDIPQLEREFAVKLSEAGIGTNGESSSPDSDAVGKLANDLVQVVLEKAAKKEQEQSSPSSNKVQIFGPGHKHRLSELWGIEHTYSVPLLGRIASNGDSGTPFVLENPDSPQTKIYRELAGAVVSEVAKAKYSKSNRRPEIRYDEDRHVLEIKNILDDDRQDEEQDDAGYTMDPAELRRACRCALCVEELTGRQILLPTMVSDSVKPLRMGPTGNYALSVDWSDGHRSLYPYRQIRSMIEEEKDRASQNKKEEEVATV